MDAFKNKRFTPREQVFVCFHRLRHYTDLNHYRTLLGMSKATAHRTLKRQVLCSITGDRIFSVHLGLGHNNDQSMFNRTLRTFNEENRITLLSDFGYSHSSLIRPEKDAEEKWRKEQQALRSVVETVCGMPLLWGVSGGRFTESPELQEVCLMITWEIVNLYLQKYPLGIRHSFLLKK